MLEAILKLNRKRISKKLKHCATPTSSARKRPRKVRYQGRGNNSIVGWKFEKHLAGVADNHSNARFSRDSHIKVSGQKPGLALSAANSKWRRARAPPYHSPASPGARRGRRGGACTGSPKVWRFGRARLSLSLPLSLAPFISELRPNWNPGLFPGSSRATAYLWPSRSFARTAHPSARSFLLCAPLLSACSFCRFKGRIISPWIISPDRRFYEEKV